MMSANTLGGSKLHTQQYRIALRENICMQIENSLFADDNNWLAAAPHCIYDILNLIWFLGYINLLALEGTYFNMMKKQTVHL